MTSTTLLWITTALMTGGGLLILAIGKRRTPSEELHTIAHGIVPLIAACSYLAMASGQGSIGLAATQNAAAAGSIRIFYFARYIDWTFTTPLLLLTLAMTAMRHVTPKRHGAVLGLLLSDVLMIATAFVFGLSETPALKWAWFAVSCLSFLGVYYVLWRPLLEANAAEREDTQATYRRNATILSVVWLIYPIVLAVAPDGLNIISDAASVFVIAVLDVVAKVVYGVMATMSDARAVDRDLAETQAVPDGARRLATAR
jgi:bacteriorhodopsin